MHLCWMKLECTLIHSLKVIPAFLAARHLMNWLGKRVQVDVQMLVQSINECIIAWTPTVCISILIFLGCEWLLPLNVVISGCRGRRELSWELVLNACPHFLRSVVISVFNWIRSWMVRGAKFYVIFYNSMMVHGKQNQWSTEMSSLHLQAIVVGDAENEMTVSSCCYTIWSSRQSQAKLSLCCGKM